MKKTLLALLVLTIAVPAMAADVTIKLRKTEEPNAVIISYTSAVGKEVRAFALNVGVSDGGYIIGKTQRRSTNYYVTPTNITFKVVGGNTDINTLGSPVVEETANGCVVEMASLYVGGPNAPPLSGDLVKIYTSLDCTQAGADRKFIVTPTVNTTPRGGVILTDGSTPTVSFSPTTVTMGCIDCACMYVGGNCGGGGTSCAGVPITQARYDAWVLLGRPKSWCHRGHFAVDGNLDCKVNSSDVVGTTPPPNNPPYLSAAYPSTYPAANYQPALDFNMDKKVNSTDVLGTTSLPGCGLKPNYPLTIANCP